MFRQIWKHCICRKSRPIWLRRGRILISHSRILLVSTKLKKIDFLPFSNNNFAASFCIIFFCSFELFLNDVLFRYIFSKLFEPLFALFKKRKKKERKEERKNKHPDQSLLLIGWRMFTIFMCKYIATQERHWHVRTLLVFLSLRLSWERIAKGTITWLALQSPFSFLTHAFKSE